MFYWFYVLLSYLSVSEGYDTMASCDGFGNQVDLG